MMANDVWDVYVLTERHVLETKGNITSNVSN